MKKLKDNDASRIFLSDKNISHPVEQFVIQK